MRRVLLGLSTMLLLVSGLIGCASGKSEFEGKWKKATSDSKSFVLELTPNNGWKYYVGNKMIEEGTYVIQGAKFIMKHKVAEHTEHDHGHDHGKEDGHGHTHKAEPDHEYGFSMSGDKKQLKLMHNGKTSVYNKL